MRCSNCGNNMRMNNMYGSYTAQWFDSVYIIYYCTKCGETFSEREHDKMIAVSALEEALEES